MEKKEIQP